MMSADVPIPDPINVDDFICETMNAVGHCTMKRVKISTEVDWITIKLPPEKCIHWPHRLPQGATVHPYITTNGKCGLQIEMLNDFLIR